VEHVKGLMGVWSAGQGAILCCLLGLAREGAGEWNISLEPYLGWVAVVEHD